MSLTAFEQKLKALCEQIKSSTTEQEATELTRKLQWMLRERFGDIKQDGAEQKAASLSSILH